MHSLIKIFNRVLLCVGHLSLVWRHTMVHVDQTDGMAKTNRDLIVVVDDLGKLVITKELLQYAEMHLSMLHLALKTTSRIHTLTLFLVDVRLVVIVQS